MDWGQEIKQCGLLPNPSDTILIKVPPFTIHHAMQHFVEARGLKHMYSTEGRLYTVGT